MKSHIFGLPFVQPCDGSVTGLDDFIETVKFSLENDDYFGMYDEDIEILENGFVDAHS